MVIIKNLITAFILVVSLVFFTGCNVKKTSQLMYQSATSSAVRPQQEVTTPFTARFEIYTNGTKRIFTQAMYHRQSPAVYIDSPDPSLIQVDTSPVTWADFFATLPFSLTEECLVTGNNQTFCTTADKKLRFLLNEVDTPDALDRPIQPGDFLKVVYGE